MKRIFIFTFLCLLYSCNVLNLDGSKPVFKINNGAFDPSIGLDAWGYDPLSATHVSAWDMPVGDLKLTLPVNDGIGHMYNFTIDWGDGTIESIGSPTTAGEMLRGTTYGFGQEPPAISHDYATAGIYTIEITGTFEAWTFFDGISTSNDHNKLIRVHSFGDLGYENLSYAFRNCTNLTHFAGGYTENVTRIDAMFYGATGLTSLDLSNFDTSNVTDMSNMFRDTTGLTSLDLSSFDTSIVTDMSYMFFGASGLTSLDVSSFNTASVTDMQSMFKNVIGLTSLDLSNFNTSNVTSMNNMFSGASGLTSLDLTNWDTDPMPSNSLWINAMTGTIFCNNPDGGGGGASGSGTVNGESCN